MPHIYVGIKKVAPFQTTKIIFGDKKSALFECQNLAVFSMPYKSWIEIDAYSVNYISNTEIKWKTEFLIK